SLTGGPYVPGEDLNDDGDFVDTGETLPIPHLQSVFGLERATGLGLNRVSLDFDAADRGAFMTAILGRTASEAARLQIVFSQGEFIGAGNAGSTEGGVVFNNRNPQRVLLDIGFPVEAPFGKK